ncbi:LOW QUALITY PROTEIN: hypothetical protein Cgig2_024217 [Carnegiea gigantea]|uniref:Uncharacterized protein n=1 Tax=Carnegiea gigantea TaxID=171969 RepID=A0A9Q1GN95_9CARY|nr:LOW QUALITY PROTEIN: hypothetical protein Cgig2_024217 [Carnegiea gigantea]
MAFSHSPDTKSMIEFVVRRFQWHRRGKAFPPSPFLKDLRWLCPDFDLATAEQAAAQFELPELPQVNFYAMLLNVAKRLGVVLTELHWGAFESWIWLFGDRAYEARFYPKGHSSEGARADGSSSGGAAAEDKELLVIACTVNMAFPPTHSTREIANYVKEAFAWHGRNATHPPRTIPQDFNVLRLRFSLAESETAAAESRMLEIVQATFYAMLLNEMLELGAVHECTAENMRSLLVGLRWSDFEGRMHIMDPMIRGHSFTACLRSGDQGRSRCPGRGCSSGRSSCPLDGDVHEGKDGPQIKGWHPQFSSLPALIDGRAVRKMAKTKSTPRMQSPDELLAEATLGNLRSAPIPLDPEAEAASCRSSTSSQSCSHDPASGHSSRSSSSEGASKSSSTGSSSGPTGSTPKGRAPTVTEILAKGPEFPGAPTR